MAYQERSNCTATAQGLSADVTGEGATPTIQATVNATLTFTSLPSSTAPDPDLASLVASDMSAYVGCSQPLVGVVVDASGPNLAINISAVYPTNSQITGATTVNPASLQVQNSNITSAICTV